MSNRPRRLSPFLETTGDSGAKVAGFNGVTQYTPEWAKGAIITMVASAASGNNTIQVQTSFDGGTTWIALGPVSTALTAAGNVSIAVYPTNWTIADATPTDLTLAGTVATVFLNSPMPPIWRLAYVVPASVTITAVYVNYLA